MKIWIGILIFSLTGSICFAEIYKWTDENGRVHYGERPSNENSEKITIKNAPASPDAGIDENRKEKQQKLLDAMEEERLEKKQKRAEATQDRKELKQKCGRLKDQYKKLKQANRYYDIDKEGNRVYLDESVLQEDISTIEKEIEKNCN